MIFANVGKDGQAEWV